MRGLLLASLSLFGIIEAAKTGAPLPAFAVPLAMILDIVGVGSVLRQKLAKDKRETRARIAEERETPRD